MRDPLEPAGAIHQTVIVVNDEVQFGTPKTWATVRSIDRHTWVTLALRSGVHPKVVQERLGHATVGITLDVYRHGTAGMQRDPAGKVARIIRGTEPS